jgi:hypothetical protein
MDKVDGGIGNYQSVEEAIEPEQAQDAEVEKESVSPFSVFSQVIEFLKTERGPGSIEDYVDNPLNFKRSMGLAQVLRGLTGFLGSMEYAVVDIVVGWIRLKGEKAEQV